MFFVIGCVLFVLAAICSDESSLMIVLGLLGLGCILWSLGAAAWMYLP